MSENLEENSPILSSSPQTLLKIASFKVALICWHREFCNIDIYSDLSINAPEFDVNDVLSMTLPKHIPEMINLRIKLISSQLISWIDYHKDKIFHSYRFNIILKCLDFIVFRSDNKIGYQSTARNLLSSDELNLEEKYRIASIYCFKEDIDRLWPSVKDVVGVSDVTIFAQYVEGFRAAIPFMAVNYWCGIKKNEYILGPELLQCEDMYPPAKMEFHWNTRNYPETSKLQAIVEMFHNDDLINHDVVIFLISRLNVIQQKHLLTLIPSEIVLELALGDVESCNCSLQVWKHVKYFITCDQFSPLLYNLWKSAFGSSTECSYVAVILRQIWITAPEHLRDHVFNNSAAVFFEKLKIPYGMPTYGRDIGFYTDLLSNLNPDLRLKLWSENWRKFICCAAVSDLNKLMKLCLADENAAISFKNEFMADYTTLKSEFESFMEAGLYEELLNYLEFSSSDKSRVQEIQQELLSSLLHEPFFREALKVNDYSLNRCVKFNEFIDRAFPSTDLAEDYKTNFIGYHFQYLRFLLINGKHLDGIRNWTTCLLSRNDIFVNVLKKYAYIICQKVVVDGEFINFNITPWQSFLKWCAPSEKENFRFKMSIPLEDIFAIYLKRVITGQKERRLRHLNTILVDGEVTCSSNYISFDNFLKWHFESDEAVSNFKCEMIQNYRNVKSIKAVLIEENMGIMFDMLKWLFNGDMIELLRFVYFFIVRTKIILRNS